MSSSRNPDGFRPEAPSSQSGNQFEVSDHQKATDPTKLMETLHYQLQHRQMHRTLSRPGLLSRNLRFAYHQYKLICSESDQKRKKEKT